MINTTVGNYRLLILQDGENKMNKLNELRQALYDWTDGSEFNTAVTLTTAYAVTSIDDIEKFYGTFTHRLNERVLRRQYSKGGKKLINFATYESDTDAETGKQKYHVHALFKRPKYKTLEQFNADVKTVILRQTKPDKSIIYTDVKDIYSGGWFNYCTKFIKNNNNSSLRVSSHAILCTAND